MYIAVTVAYFAFITFNRFSIKSISYWAATGVYLLAILVLR